MTQTNLSCDNSWCACGYVFCLKIKITNLKFLTMIRIGNSMICSDTFHKYHECDISKLLYVASRAVRRVKFETILRYHEWYLCQMSTTNHAIICSCYYRNVREYHLIFESKRKKTEHIYDPNKPQLWKQLVCLWLSFLPEWLLDELVWLWCCLFQQLEVVKLRIGLTESVEGLDLNIFKDSTFTFNQP